MLLDDIVNNSDSTLNIENSVKKLRKPYLIIHGNQDLAVPLSEAEQLYEWSDKERTNLEVITGTGHTFDIKHPFEGSTKAFDNVLEKTFNFFNSSFSEN